MEKLLIVGGSGMVGNQLQKKLTNRGYSVSILGRTKHKLLNVKSYIWDVKQKTIDEEAIKSADFIVNLAGAGIADGRWTDSRKETILSSRVDSTKLLIQPLIKTDSKPKAYVAASAVGCPAGPGTVGKSYPSVHSDGGLFPEAGEMPGYPVAHCDWRA